MKYKPALSVYILIASLIAVLTIQSCKDEAVVESKNPENQNPNTPALVSPANNSTLDSLTPALDWQDFSGAAGYRLQVSLDANFAGTMIMDSSGITSSGLGIPAGFLPSGSYIYWRVNAVTSAGTTSWSAIWRFHVILGPPAAPTLVSPPDGSINQPYTPVLDWNDVPHGDIYRVQIGTTPLFNTLVLDTPRINVSQLQVPQYVLLVNSQYYWRVNASNSGGVSTGPWSSAWSFTIMDGPEPNSISGTITFVDTSFLPSPQFYKVGAFQSWPPSTAPQEYDSLAITQIGGVYKANYKITRLGTGRYYVAVYPEIETSLTSVILGIYGCDTVHVNYSTCPQNPTGVNIINNWGVENKNFLTWADTTKRIF